MPYISVAQRNSQSKTSGYIPVVQRTATTNPTPTPSHNTAPRVPEGKGLSWIQNVGNFVQALPKAATETILTPTMRLIGGAVNTVAQNSGGNGLIKLNKDSNVVDPQATGLTKIVQEELYGTKPLGTSTTEGQDFLKSVGLGKYSNNSGVNTTVGLGLTALEFLGEGKAKGVFEAIAKEKNALSIRKILKDIGIVDELASEAAPKLAKMTDELQVKKAIESMAKTQESTRAVPKVASQIGDLSPNRLVQTEVRPLAQEGIAPKTPELLQSTLETPVQKTPIPKLSQSIEQTKTLDNVSLKSSSYLDTTPKAVEQSSASNTNIIKELENIKKDLAVAVEKNKGDLRAEKAVSTEVSKGARVESKLTSQIDAVKRNSELSLLKERIVGRSALQDVKAKGVNAISNIKQQQKDFELNRQALVDYANKNLPLNERGKLLPLVKNTKTVDQLLTALDRVDSVSSIVKQAEATQRVIGQQKSLVAFLRKVNELPQKLITEARAKVGIEDWKKVTPEQLTEFINEIKTRNAYRREQGYRPVGERIPQTVNPEIYSKVREAVKPTMVEKAKTSITKGISHLAKGTDEVLGVISTRLKNIHPDLKRAIRNFEYDAHQFKAKARESVTPFLGEVKKMEKGDLAEFDLALKNGDMNKISEYVGKYNLQDSYFKTRQQLDVIYREAKAVGYDLGYQKDFFPRIVKDSEGLLTYLQKGDNWSLIQKAITNRSIELGRALTVDEQAQIANSMIRGYNPTGIRLSTPGALKTRQIEVIDSELNKFYENSFTSLNRYIETVGDAVSAKKFFGKGENINDSIGAYVLKLLTEGKIKVSQEKEVRAILEARFNPGRIGPVLGAIKQVSYIDVMGSFTSAITQIGDLGFSIYKAGPYNTIVSSLRHLTGKTAITLHDLGIEKIAAEFDDASKLSKLTEGVFKLTGLAKLDRFGKEVYVDSVLKTLQNQSKNPSTKFISEIEQVFGTETKQVINDLQSGEVSDNVRYLMFNKLLDITPTALSEMPQKYLSGGNTKILYMLKSYTIKVLDVYRNEVMANVKTNPMEAAKNFTKLTLSLVAMNATADEIKNFILGRPTKLSDVVIDNIFKQVGFSRYSADSVTKSGLGQTVRNIVAPPTKSLDNLTKSGQRVRSIPLVGEPYYWWMGGGATQNSKQSKGSLNLDTNIKLDKKLNLDTSLNLK